MRYLLQNAICLYICFATVVAGYSQGSKPKTSPGGQRPSKEVTLNYIKDKYNKYGTDYVMKDGYVMHFYSNGNAYDNIKNTEYTMNNISFVEKGNQLFLQGHLLKTIDTKDYDRSDHKIENYEYLFTAPFNQVNDITIGLPRKEGPGFYLQKEDGGYQFKQKSYFEHYLLFNFSSNCVIISNVNDPNFSELENYFIIGFKYGEDELLTKLLRAFNTLKLYYPKPKSNDPFEND
ncbi:hypothetical protein GCM10027592_03290 [Spirosoma flavus]